VKLAAISPPSDVTQARARPSRLRPERPWQEHAILYRDLFADPPVAAALWPRATGGPGARWQAWELLAADIRHWAERSYGPWVFFEADTGMFVGRGGLRAASVAGEECVEVLYAVRSDAWGRGYATEMATLAVAYARRLEITEVVAFTAVSNRASRQVLEKVGIRMESTFERGGVAHWLGRLRPIV
jgi:[ribosomal protein S5]-alanine N-acetyltransferase